MNDPQKLLPALAAIEAEGLPSTSSGTDPSTTHLPCPPRPGPCMLRPGP